MQGLVKNPFSRDLDDKLKEVDSSIPVPLDTVEEIIEKTMRGVFKSKRDDLKEAVEKTGLSKYDLMKPVKRVLIHARGCTAVKLIPKAQKKGIEVVLIQSDPDMDSIAVDLLSENDQAVCIGGNTPDESYLNALSVLKVAEHEKVDSLHPGIGFLSENAQFAEICLNHGINFIGPSVYSMEIMGNKSNAINTALYLNVPVVPGSHGIITSSEKAAEIADKIGYPVILKAVHGGGGKGIKKVENSSHIHTYFNIISAEAKSAFGNGDIYVEKYVTSLRHIEIQILRDVHGNTKILGLRDCSVQRNNQKLIEESESAMLPDQLKQKAFEYALRIADRISYLGAGTVEFIYDLDCNEIYFMEMNTRLQVEHPVTELVSGVDIVGAQFDIAGSGSIENLSIKNDGYAMEVRINAEKAVIESDDSISFVPTPGKVTECIIPEDDCVQVISTIGRGKTLSPFYDSMVIQVICHGENRENTIDRLIAFLSGIKIEGICTNIPLILRILQDSVFRMGEYDTAYLTRFLENIDKKNIVNEIEKASGLSKLNVDFSSLKIEGSEEIKVLSPSTGVYYSSPTPEDSDFVKVGDKISINDPLCLIEAMKLYTHFSLNLLNNTESTIFKPSKKYEITRINSISGEQVNKGDLLFIVKQCR
jgi:acetyl/propionyl-CoA carboxylase alpha subunit